MANLLLRKDTICRTCLKEAINCKSLSAKLDGDNRTLCEVLSFITSFDIIINEKYPKQICNECYTMISKTDEFKKRCIQSESLLKNEYLNSTLLVDEFIKQDLSPNISNSLPFQSLILNENSLLNLKQVSPQGVDYEIPFGRELEDKEGFESHIKECKEENCQDSALIPHCIQCKEVFESFDLLQTHIEVHHHQHDKKEQNQCEKSLNNQIDICPNDTVYSQIEYLDTNDVSTSSKIIVRDTSTKAQIRVVQECDTCQYTKEESLKNLENKKKGKESSPVSCSDSNWLLPNVKAFDKHLAKHRKKIEKKKFQCSMCARNFFTRSLLIAHIKTHEDKDGQRFICKTCKREFKHQAHLENHIETAHTKIKGYKCDTCTKSFSNQESLDYHKQQHMNSRKYQCNVCSKTFAVHSVLNEHLRTHTGEKPFLCSICGRGFTQKTNLAQHMRRHQGLKPYKCSSCDKSFVSKGELDAHTRKHTGKHPFVCDECGNGFTTSSSLTKHRRIHTGEKRYACDLCTMRFTALGTLKNHRRTHTGEKPYQCSLCEKAFIQRQDLVGHIRCHTGERPFTCTSCGQGFRKSSALKVHLRSHGNDMLVM